MGFLDRYQDRGPTVREVFEAARRVRDAMRYDWRRDVAPERTVFTGAGHVEALKAVLAAADPACVVLDLPAPIRDGGVFALDEAREPVRVSADRIPDLVRAVEAGETLVATVVRLAGQPESET